ncbi:MAG: hypothetical protein ACYCTL_07325 [Acidimicrobiales bacterium]
MDRAAIRRSRRARLGLSGLVVVIGVTLAACTSARNTLGTSSSQCYQALPVAAGAVHRRGEFAGVRLVPPSVLAEKSHERLRSVLATRAGAGVGHVCAVAYRGSFKLDQVARPIAIPPVVGTGGYAVVVVSVPANRVLATFVLDHLPISFRHNGLGT